MQDGAKRRGVQATWLSRRARYASIVVVAAIAALTGLTLGDRMATPSMPPPSLTRGATPSPSSQASTGPSSGPTVWYSVLGDGRLTLYERRLDGRSEAIELAWRPSDEEGESSFIVGPGGSPILVAQRASRRWSIQPVSRGHPQGTPSWSRRVEWADFANGVWTPDGRYWASYGDDNDEVSYAIVLDTADGDVWKLPLGRREGIQGFDGAGPDLVVRDDDEARSGQADGVRFKIIDPATGERRDAEAAELDASPRSSYAIDVAPRAGLFVTEHARQDGRLIIGDIRTGAQIVIHQAERTFHWVGFFPAADRVAGVHYLAEDRCGETQQSLIVAGITGGVRELWRGTASPLDMVFAPEGDMLGFDAWGPTGSSMTVVDSLTGRWVDLPTPEGSYDGELLAIRGGESLPEQAVAPNPSEAPPTAAPMPALVSGAPQLVTGSVEHDMATCDATIRVRLMAPTVDGGLAVIDELPPVVFADVDRHEASVQVLPRPGTATVLVSYGDGRTREVYLWTPDPDRTSGENSAIEPVALPVDWPHYPTWLVWFPDGEALAKGSARRGRDFLWFELGDPMQRRLRTSDSWGEVVGWTTDGSSIVVRRQSCIDACDAEFTWLSVVQLSDGQIRDVTPDAPIDAVGTGTESVSVRIGLAAYVHATQIDFSEGINVPGDFSLPWPARAGAFDPEWMRGVWSRDGRSLYVVADAAEGRALLRIDDPQRDAPLRPKVVGHVPDGAIVDEVEIAGTWAHIQVWGLGSCREGLANLETGEAYLGSGCVMSQAWFSQP